MLLLTGDIVRKNAAESSLIVGLSPAHYDVALVANHVVSQNCWMSVVSVRLTRRSKDGRLRTLMSGCSRRQRDQFGAGRG
jgi:hypothetical protein